jgi:hypothetical protein
VLLLGVRTGWSEREILALPVDRFNFYIDQLTKEEDDDE